MAKRYLGLWKLLPELCKYDVGQAPAKATYAFTLSQTHPIIDVTIDWTDQQGKSFNVGYQMELGVKKADKFHGLDVMVLHQLNEKGLLNSTVWHHPGDKLLMKSFRELKEEDQRLEVVMETPTENGVNRIFQVYQKVQ